MSIYIAYRRRKTSNALSCVLNLVQISLTAAEIDALLFKAFVFTKAFDVIDRNVLFNKFVNCGMPEHVVAWSMDFLCGRKQFVKLADSVSSVSHVTAGTPQDQMISSL